MAKVGTIPGHSVDTGNFLSVTNVEMEIDVRCELCIWKYLGNALNSMFIISIAKCCVCTLEII